jgi:hypothetical protein
MPSPAVTPVASSLASPTPKATPSASATASHAPAPTPTGTPEVSATPQATPSAIGDFIDQIVTASQEHSWPVPAKQDVTNLIAAAYRSDSQAAAVFNAEAGTTEMAVIDKTWRRFTSDDPDGKVTDGGYLVGYLYWEGWLVDQNSLWDSTISGFLNHAHSVLDAQRFLDLVDAAKSLQAPPF